MEGFRKIVWICPCPGFRVESYLVHAWSAFLLRDHLYQEAGRKTNGKAVFLPGHAVRYGLG